MALMQADDIKKMIEGGLPECEARVLGDDGVHFEAEVVSGAFVGASKLEQHKMVFATLGDNLRDGVIHALSLRTYTPQQWPGQEQS